MDNAGSLYAVEFSNGLIKVGRGADPAARIKSHIERLSVAGVVPTRQHINECRGPSAAAEQIVIGLCAERASEKRKNEWFMGLLFEDVRAWIDVAAARELPADTRPKYRLRRASFPLPVEGSYVCRACCTHHSANDSDAYVCEPCRSLGYAFSAGKRSQLTRSGEPVPLWTEAVGKDDCRDYPGVTCEELRPDIAWFRVPHADHLMGNAFVDHQPPRAGPVTVTGV